MKKEMISFKLKEWFFLNRRVLPWRENSSPYEVWVSEVMLQQTQVAVVISYFKKWIQTFPTIHHLAKASSDQVIKSWEGLGYYARARNLHNGAKYIVDRYKGIIPCTYDELKKIKGLGPYTIGAILSFAYKQKIPAVDGNVLRVLSRYYLIEEAIDKRATYKKIENLTKELLPDFEPWIVMEALIELGALICRKKPQCSICPLKQSCGAHLNFKTEQIPIKKKREKTVLLYRHIAIIHDGKKVLLCKREQGNIMANLWEFPYVDLGVNCEKSLGISLKLIKKLPEVSHGFTKYKAFLYPYLYFMEQQEVEGCSWVSYRELWAKPFSSGHRRIMQNLKDKKILQ